MPIVLVPPQVAISKQTGETIRGGTGKVYADTDYNLTSELTCYTDATGDTTTQPKSSSEAIIPEFWVNLPVTAAGVLWVAGGVRVWLASRETYRGRPGSDGANGKTAYQYAVEGGYQGSEADFRAEQREVGEAATNAAASAAEAQAAREAAESALGRVDAPTDTVVSDLVGRSTSSTQASLNARYATKEIATSAAAGLMAAADKAKLDAATSLPTASRVMQRDASGRAQVAEPVAASDIAPKSYVDITANTAATLVQLLPNPGGGDLNTYTATGRYRQPANAAALVGTNYPAPFAGLLTVSTDNPNMVFQTYQTYGASSANRLYWRANYNSAWQPWQEVASVAQVQAEGITNRQLSYQLTHHVNTTPPFVYHVARVRTYGKFVPGIVEKHLAGDYEKTYTSGAFSPTAAPLRTHERETGGTFLVNSSAWADAGPMTGVVIKDGVAYSDFPATAPKGRHALGVMKDGRFRIFQKGTDTAASMVAAGVTDTFVYGPPVVRNGVKEDMTAISAEWPDDRRPRTLLGQSATGDVIIVVIEGDRAPRLGANFTDCANLAVSLGMHNGIIMDGGGSTQGISSGAFFAFSSDSNPRPVKESLVLHLPQGNPKNDDTAIWTEFPATTGTGTLRYRLTNAGGERRLLLRGSVTGITAINAVVANLPPECRPSDWVYVSVMCVNGALVQMAAIAVKSNGEVQIQRKENTTWSASDRYDFNVEIALN